MVFVSIYCRDALERYRNKVIIIIIKFKSQFLR